MDKLLKVTLQTVRKGQIKTDTFMQLRSAVSEDIKLLTNVSETGWRVIHWLDGSISADSILIRTTNGAMKYTITSSVVI